jgi:hypothetical protein
MGHLFRRAQHVWSLARPKHVPVVATRAFRSAHFSKTNPMALSHGLPFPHCVFTIPGRKPSCLSPARGFALPNENEIISGRRSLLSHRGEPAESSALRLQPWARKSRKSHYFARQHIDFFRARRLVDRLMVILRYPFCYSVRTTISIIF